VKNFVLLQFGIRGVIVTACIRGRENQKAAHERQQNACTPFE